MSIKKWCTRACDGWRSRKGKKIVRAQESGLIVCVGGAGSRDQIGASGKEGNGTAPGVRKRAAVPVEGLLLFK